MLTVVQFVETKARVKGEEAERTAERKTSAQQLEPARSSWPGSPQHLSGPSSVLL